MGRRSKKKISDACARNGQLVDPLSNLQVSAQSYDLSRIASVYGDSSGQRWWTKAWFNGNDKGEPSVEISRQLAVSFIQDKITKDDWLSRYFPKQMNAIVTSIEKTRQQLLGM